LRKYKQNVISVWRIEGRGPDSSSPPEKLQE
jgi:hypothetical protein